MFRIVCSFALPELLQACRWLPFSTAVMMVVFARP